MLPTGTGSERIGFVAFGLLMLALLVGSGFVFPFGVIVSWRAAVLTRYGIRVEGRVVGTHTGPVGSEETAEYRIVELTNVQGHTRRHRLT